MTFRRTNRPAGMEALTIGFEMGTRPDRLFLHGGRLNDDRGQLYTR
jgi:hypothetical protein